MRNLLPTSNRALPLVRMIAVVIVITLALTLLSGCLGSMTEKQRLSMQKFCADHGGVHTYLVNTASDMDDKVYCNDGSSETRGTIIKILKYREVQDEQEGNA